MDGSIRCLRRFRTWPALVGLSLALGTGTAAFEAGAHLPPPSAPPTSTLPGLAWVLDRLPAPPTLGALGMDPLAGILPQPDTQLALTLPNPPVRRPGRDAGTQAMDGNPEPGSPPQNTVERTGGLQPPPLLDPATTARIQHGYGRLPMHFEPNQGQTADEVRYLARGAGYSLFLTDTEAVLVLRKGRGPGQEGRTGVTTDVGAGFTAMDGRDVRDARREPLLRSQHVRHPWRPGAISDKTALDPADRPQAPASRRLPASRPTGTWESPEEAGAGRGPALNQSTQPNSVGAGSPALRTSNSPADLGNAPNTTPERPGAAPKRGQARAHGGMHPIPGDRPAPTGEDPPQAAVVRMRLEGATHNPAPAVAGLERQPGISNYILGNDPAKWRSGVPHYARVQYDQVYPGIDLVFYGNPQQLEYDLVVAPGADPGQIRLSFEGVDGMRIDGEENLVLAVAGGEIVQKAPRVFQWVEGQKRVVAGRYVLLEGSVAGGAAGEVGMADGGDGRAVGFALAAYDSAQALVIDPVVVYSTYLGGSSDEYGYGIAVDGAGNAYVTGQTQSVDFPTVNARYPHLWGDTDAFVTKLDPQGQGPVYSTYLGGSSSEDGEGIAVDGAGNAYVTGFTTSADLPTVNARYPSLWGTEDAFVTKLDPQGQGPVYSTYLGGSSEEGATGIAVDGAGNAYVTGETWSADFPTVNARYPALPGYGDAFVTKLDPHGQGPVYSTFLGGSSSADGGLGIAVDGAGNAYVTGWTLSFDFPTANARYPNRWGYRDAFVTKFDPRGQGPVYSTYLGGSDGEQGTGIAVDGAGNAYVTGWTASTDFPTVNAHYPYLGAT